MLPPIVTKKRRRFSVKRMHGGKIVFPVLLLIFGVGVVTAWYVNNRYTSALRPLSSETTKIRVVVAEGQSAEEIGKLLQEKKVIKSASAFSHYVARKDVKNRLKAGGYVFAPNYSVAQIVQMLVDGKTDAYNLTITPGRRVDQIKDSLVGADFNEAAVVAALQKKYDHPLFAGKPATADLEGYIFPDTYQLDSQAGPETLLVRTFDNFYKKIQDKGIINKLNRQDLSLFEAITVASIVQQETANADEQRKVAQVFLSRLKIGMPLGADPTFRYASRKAGVPDSVRIDSPYNTRIYGGLPPGPIGNFNFAALEAVANPATTDYLYFVAGDDGVTYFSHTLAEHERLTREHCIELCKL